MSSSMSSCALDCCVSKSSSSKSSSIEHGKCSYRPCSVCLNWHCSCTPCGVREKARYCKLTQCDVNGALGCTCNPRCIWKCERGSWRLHCSEVSLSDVVHEVEEEDIKVYREDVSKNSCYRGSEFNVCRAYIGDDDEKVAVKWVRSSHACGKDHISILIKEAKKCAKLVRAFMNKVDTQGWKVKVLVPKIGRGYFFYDVRSRPVVVEPYLKNFKVFYESVDDLDYLHGSTSAMVIQALIHFSIRYSRRESIMTNLQGSVDFKKKTIYLSAPEIKEGLTSSSGRSPIHNFLRDHECSRMCRKC